MYKVTNEEPVPLLDLKPDLSVSLVEIIKKALAKDPKERYQTCLDFSYDLRVALRGFSETVADEKVRDALDYVHHVPFFKNFTKEQVTELGLASTIVKFFKDKTIVAEGEIDDTFFIILSGKARIRRNNQDIATIGIGQCFGEMAYISGQPRAASVIAEEDCILMKISATLIDGASESIQLLFYKNFATTLVHRLSNKLPPPEAH
jgi:serine/threonine-protein kinase